MNRRQIMISMGAALAASVTAIPVWARPAMTFGGRVRWLTDTLNSPHATLIASTINDIIDAKVLYTTGDYYMGNKITLTDPTFMVAPSDIMWHGTRGYRFEPSLELEVHERGFLIGRARMFSRADDEAYYGRPLEPGTPMYGLKAIHTPYERPTSRNLTIRDANWQPIESRVGDIFLVTSETLREQLGDDAVGMDDRWLRAWLGKQA